MKQTTTNYLLTALTMVLVMMPMVVLGATIKFGEEVTVSSNATVEDNLYVAGGNVAINSFVPGDLYTAGGVVLVSENVAKDIVAAGGTVTILGDAGEDVRVAGGNVLVHGSVGGELIVTGGSVVVSTDVVVAQDLVAAAGQTTVAGEVWGDVELYGGVAMINGRVAGDVIAKIDGILTIGSDAVIDGNIAYSAQTADALQIEDGSVVTGAIVFEEIEVPMKAETDSNVAVFIEAIALLQLLSAVVVALVVALLFKRFSNSVVIGVVIHPLRMLGLGLTALIVTPVAVILLFVTLLGIPLGLMLLSAYFTLLVLSGIYAGIVTGSWFSSILYSSNRMQVSWKNVIGGVVLLVIISLIPVVGWIFWLFMFLVALGSITDILWQELQKIR